MPEQAGGVWHISGYTCGPTWPRCLHCPSTRSSDFER
jgi:hypothetical protein